MMLPKKKKKKENKKIRKSQKEELEKVGISYYKRGATKRGFANLEKNSKGVFPIMLVKGCKFLTFSGSFIKWF